MSETPASRAIPPQTLDGPLAAYAQARPQYVRFTAKLETLLRDLLAAKGVEYHLLEARTKDIQSFRDKITRSAKIYTNPLSDLTDLSGLRVIAYYQDDVDAIGRLIESELIVDVDNSLQTNAGPAEFGYRSAHYVVRLSDARGSLLEWGGLSGLKAEIQVRTVLQHAWAAISHKLQYKREEDAPAPLRRKLFRLSALFELADDEFVSLRDASGTLTRDINAQLAAGNQQIPIDYVSLRQFISDSPVVAELSAAAAEVGFEFDDIDGLEQSDTLSDLIQLTGIAGLSTLAEFDALLSEATTWGTDYLREQIGASIDASKSKWQVTPEFVCELVLIRAKIGRLRLGHLLRLGWHRDIAKRVLETAQRFGGNSPRRVEAPQGCSAE